MMDSLSNEHRDPALLAHAGRRRRIGAALQLALTIALILSIVVVLAVAGTSGAMAQNSDLMVMEESTAFTTALIVGVIVVVMGCLTVLAIRDASPNKRGPTRRTTISRR